MSQTPTQDSTEGCLCPTAEQALAAERTFNEDHLAMLGHEIRNPLCALSYALEVWPNAVGNPAQVDELLQIMRRQVAHLNRLCRDLLDIGRVSKGGLFVCRNPLDLRSSLSDACEQIRPLVRRGGLTMSVALSNTPIRVLGDESRLTQVFANLMQNAAKFTDIGGRLHISLKQDYETAVISVEDNGRGICAERLESLFDGDKVVKKCRESTGEGLGIGLRLAKSIVELHGGSIRAFSAGPGLGSVFEVRLPMIPTDVSVEPKSLQAGFVITSRSKPVPPR